MSPMLKDVPLPVSRPALPAEAWNEIILYCLRNHSCQEQWFTLSRVCRMFRYYVEEHVKDSLLDPPYLLPPTPIPSGQDINSASAPILQEILERHPGRDSRNWRRRATRMATAQFRIPRVPRLPECFTIDEEVCCHYESDRHSKRCQVILYCGDIFSMRQGTYSGDFYSLEYAPGMAEHLVPFEGSVDERRSFRASRRPLTDLDVLNSEALLMAENNEELFALAGPSGPEISPTETMASSMDLTEGPMALFEEPAEPEAGASDNQLAGPSTTSPNDDKKYEVVFRCYEYQDAATVQKLVSELPATITDIEMFVPAFCSVLSYGQNVPIGISRRGKTVKLSWPKELGLCFGALACKWDWREIWTKKCQLMREEELGLLMMTRGDQWLYTKPESRMADGMLELPEQQQQQQQQ